MEDLPPAMEQTAFAPQDVIVTHVDPQAQPFLQLVKKISGDSQDSLILINSRVDEKRCIFTCEGMTNPIPPEVFYMPEACQPTPGLENIDWTPEDRGDDHGAFTRGMREMLGARCERDQTIYRTKQWIKWPAPRETIPARTREGMIVIKPSAVVVPTSPPPGPPAPSSSDSSSTAGYTRSQKFEPH